MADIIQLGNHRAVTQAQPDKQDDIFFPVSQVNLSDLTGMKDTGLSAIVRDDTETVLAVHSKRYSLTPNEIVFNALDRIISRSPSLDTNGMTINDRVAYAGGKTVRQYTFPEHRVETQRGDFTELRLTAMNSYDGSSNLNVKMGGYRLACLNGMSSGDWFGEFKNRHTSLFNIGEMELYLQNAVENFMVLGNVWRRWAQTPTNPVEVRAWLDEFTKGSKRLSDLLFCYYERETRSMGHNLWSLYNALTFWATHETVKKSAEGNVAAIQRERDARVSKALTGKGFNNQIFKVAA